MTLYQLTVAQEGDRRLVLILTQLGAVTRPMYLCQLRHQGGNFLDASAPLSFFLEQLVDPTEAINAVVSLARGLTALAGVRGLVAAQEKAGALTRLMHTEEFQASNAWEKMKALFIGLEMEQFSHPE